MIYEMIYDLCLSVGISKSTLTHRWSCGTPEAKETRRWAVMGAEMSRLSLDSSGSGSVHAKPGPYQPRA